jgi:MoxR-like ATPase
VKPADVVSVEEAQDAAAVIERLRETLRIVLFGQDAVVDAVVVGVLARGHLLIESLPGLGKTMLAKGLARALGLSAQRIQFTPDLLPGDITGNPVLQEIDGRRAFVFQAGPVFAHVVLADEINRASPKTQSALLEAMQEQHVTVFGERHALPDPFFVLATQNPIELEGTYPLPEAQLDRFLMKLEVPRNAVDVLERIVNEREIGFEPEVPRVLDADGLGRLLASVRRVYLPDVVTNYIARLVDATHPGQSTATAHVRYGASPRAAIALAAVARARALLAGRQNASFEDVSGDAVRVLQHRLVLDYQARLSGRTAAAIVEDLLAEVPRHDRPLPATLTTPVSPA